MRGVGAEWTGGGGAEVEMAYTEERFWSNTMPCPPSDCILWMKTTFHDGYGMITWRGKKMHAHRVAFFFKHGYFPHVGRHTCDTRLCVNPNHILDGTHKDNMRDKLLRGRTLRGEDHPQARFSDEFIEAIRVAEGTQAEISARLGISQAHISRIKRRQARSPGQDPLPPKTVFRYRHPSYVGIFRNLNGYRWRAVYKHKTVGWFDTPEQARDARQRAMECK